MKMETDVMLILDQCRIEGNLLFLPDIQLDRKLYVRVNKVLDLMGGKWNRSKKAHVFQIDNAADLLNQCIETGEITDVYKKLQFFETPPAVVDTMLEYAAIEPGDSVMEPSAGKGAIAKRLLDCDCRVEVCEIHEPFQNILIGLGCRTYRGDFLEYPTYRSNLVNGVKFEKIIANPPFSRQQDIDHASKMLDLLPAGGRLVCIMSASVQFRTNAKTRMFLSRLNLETDHEFIALPDGSFKDSGTMVRVVMLVAEKG